MEQLTFRYTVDEALKVAQQEPPRATGAASRREDGDWHGDNWHGDTFEEAVRMASEGDPREAAALGKKLGVLASIRTGRRVKQVWDVAGSAVDVGRYLAGEPDNMMTVVRARRVSPVLKLAIERCVAAAVQPETMRATGASVLAAVEALRTAGVPSEVWVTFTTRGVNMRKLSAQVLIQEAGRPLDVDRLAYWTCNPTALRRLGFALWEQQSEAIRNEFRITLGGGYGSAAVTDKDDFDEVAPASEYAVTEWLTDVLSRRAGIEIAKGVQL